MCSNQHKPALHLVQHVYTVEETNDENITGYELQIASV